MLLEASSTLTAVSPSETVTTHSSDVLATHRDVPPSETVTPHSFDVLATHRDVSPPETVTTHTCDVRATHRVNLRNARHAQVSAPSKVDRLYQAEDAGSSAAGGRDAAATSARSAGTDGVSPQAVKMRQATNLPALAAYKDVTPTVPEAVGASGGGGVQVLFGGEVWTGKMGVDTRCCGLVEGALPTRTPLGYAAYEPQIRARLGTAAHFYAVHTLEHQRGGLCRVHSTAWHAAHTWPQQERVRR